MTAIFIDHQPRDRIAFNDKLVRDSYTDSAPIGNDLPKYAVAVICARSSSEATSVEAIAIGSFRRSVRVTSFARRYEVSGISLLRRPVQLEAVLDRVSPQIKPHVASARTAKSALPEGSSTAVVRVLSDLTSDAADLIEQASGYPTGTRQITEARRTLLAEEKDTLGLIAEISGLGRRLGQPGRALMTPPDELDTRRTLMETVRLGYNDEDTLIERDMERFDGILGQRARRNARGMLIPLHGGGRLTVLNTNKRDLETTRGSDLIYYHADRHCGILVQYKRMKQDPDGGWTYRGDPQLAAQLRSMRALEVGKQPGTVGQYRLSTQPHYLKIVRPSDYDGQSTELMKGLYLPLDLVGLMHESTADMTMGGDNLRITWDDERWPTQRHLNNTDFTQLFRDGWIGSCGTTSDEIRSWLEPLFDADELITVAIAEGTSVRART
ncbi:hypothetical protein [Actinoplanes sp. NBRC 103695]|uniref:hypothetical protein n=1 Tax=Actinoplanes sp. NBRC 103695 TaxID=3032202 RepID=UPI0024A3E75D|nr:hypothetical protein [Actinoplanes sp. NBRC 103695]GLY98779.1 hypothetical protein Acsp02_60330 [Actinoplanes sp. NBRC 103695]